MGYLKAQLPTEGDGVIGPNLWGRLLISDTPA
jgi:hypothetical protein